MLVKVYLGCYPDRQTYIISQRDLSGAYISLPSNNPANCIAKCRSLRFQYAGLQAGYFE
jgi:hypothetical protein